MDAESCVPAHVEELGEGLGEGLENSVMSGTVGSRLGVGAGSREAEHDSSRREALSAVTRFIASG
jgi:hypothetical protein